MNTLNNSSVAGALTNDQVFSLTYIYLAVLPLSLIGSGSVIAVSLAKKKCFKVEVRPLFILSLSDFLAGFFLVSTAVIELLPQRLYVGSYSFCTYGIMLALMFYAVSYLMVVVYAFEVHRAVRNIRNARASTIQEEDNTDESSRLYLQYGLAWLIPLLLFLTQVITGTSSMTDIVPVYMDNQSGSGHDLFCSSCIILIHNSKDFCFKYLEEGNVGLGRKITFFLYLLVVMTCCTVLYCRLNLHPETNEEMPLLSVGRDSFARIRTQSAYRRARFFQLSFVLCWAPAFILSIFSFTSVKPSLLYPLFILQALTVSLQGFINSLAYGWSRQNFRREVTGERTQLNSSELQKAFFEESLVVSEQ
ncbi:transmembrane protein 116-like [Pleurodeles waltl]|uniref:transmembrane protein 116-like n=1 Tax=Pleurodeles waltl TaxID=8319 RepID=UPI00370956ED